jgi:hypothetical protein
LTPPAHAGLHAERRSSFRLIAYGGAFGASIALLEFAYYYPQISTSDKLGLAWLPSLLLGWCGEGALLGLTVALFERWQAPRLLGDRQLAIAVAIGAIAGVLIWQAFEQLVLRERFGIWVFRDHAVHPVNLAGIVGYHIWLMLLFGGLAAAAYLSRERHARMLAALRAAELGRETSRQRLAQAHLAAFQACIDPRFVIQSLTKLEQLYETDPQGADRLLEELIAFLRAALGSAQAPVARPRGSDEALQPRQRMVKEGRPR